MKNDALGFYESESETGDRYNQAWNDMFSRFYEDRKAAILEEFMNAAVDSVILRVHQDFTALENLKSEFASYINSGKFAKRELNKA